MTLAYKEWTGHKKP